MKGHMLHPNQLFLVKCAQYNSYPEVYPRVLTEATCTGFIRYIDFLEIGMGGPPMNLSLRT